VKFVIRARYCTRANRFEVDVQVGIENQSPSSSRKDGVDLGRVQLNLNNMILLGVGAADEGHVECPKSTARMVLGRRAPPRHLRLLVLR